MVLQAFGECMYMHTHKIHTKFWVALTKVFWFAMNGTSKYSLFGGNNFLKKLKE